MIQAWQTESDSFFREATSISERKMFGGLAFLMNGNMVCGVVKDHLMLRIGPEAVATALFQPHTRPMDFTGKPLKSMIYVDADGVDSDAGLRVWVESAVAFVKTLPSKKEFRGS